MGRLLDGIKGANDIKRIPERRYPELAQEIRDFLIENVSQTGGHLASNLGVVEITMALHRCLDLPKDKIIFDVGHQSYVHKILTGRKDRFSTLRKKDGLCGFPKIKESPYDAFGAGHSSTSLSAAVGMAVARDLKQSDELICAIIGDGALSGGMAYEALNNMALLKKNKSNLIIILNDNKMSIAENVGGMSRYLSGLRTKKEYGDLKNNIESALKGIPAVGSGVARTVKRSKDSIKKLFVPGMFFENMGITYYGPVDGNNIHDMIHAIWHAKQHPGPILIHAITKKGYGYVHAENNPERFHGLDSFDPETGESLGKKGESYTDVFAKQLISLAKQNQRIVAITAAMPSGTGLSAFKKEYPERFFDVGIAEEHAVTFAAGLAAQGLKPFFAVYSSFLQRGYDQLLHDVCIQKLPVTLCIDRSGLVGADGETHQGVFDISYLSHIPNLSILAPKSGRELETAMEFAADYQEALAIKYARGMAYPASAEDEEPWIYGKSQMIREGKDLVILSVGTIYEEVNKAVVSLEEEGIETGVVNVRFLRPLDEEMLHDIAKKYSHIVTVEENVLTGAYGERVSRFLHEHAYDNTLINIGIPDCFVEHATVAQQRESMGIDAKSIVDTIMKRLK